MSPSFCRSLLYRKLKRWNRKISYLMHRWYSRRCSKCNSRKPYFIAYMGKIHTKHFLNRRVKWEKNSSQTADLNNILSYMSGCISIRVCLCKFIGANLKNEILQINREFAKILIKFFYGQHGSHNFKLAALYSASLMCTTSATFTERFALHLIFITLRNRSAIRIISVALVVSKWQRFKVFKIY